MSSAASQSHVPRDNFPKDQKDPQLGEQKKKKKPQKDQKDPQLGEQKKKKTPKNPKKYQKYIIMVSRPSELWVILFLQKMFEMKAKL